MTYLSIHLLKMTNLLTCAMIAFVLSLLVGSANAQELPPTEFVRPCVTFAWPGPLTPPDPIEYYEVWQRTENESDYDWWHLADVYVEDGLTYRNCNTKYNVVFELLVRAVTEYGDIYAFSDPSISYVWIRSFDYNEDGVVGFADFGIFSYHYGTCNNGWKVVPCEEVAAYVVEVLDSTKVGIGNDKNEHGTWMERAREVLKAAQKSIRQAIHRIEKAKANS
jgi:hypothetical protein